jgi:hypothetical protein
MSAAPGYDTLDAFINTPAQALSYLHLVHAGIQHAKHETTVLDSLEDILAILIEYQERQREAPAPAH